jgi:hypothetical protein
MKRGRKRRQRIERLNKLFGEIGGQQGLASERCFDEVLSRARSEGRLPPWLLSWEHMKKNSAADKAGTDFLVRTDRGNIRVNIKSSRIFATLSERRHRNRVIVLIVINILKPHHRILSEVISILGKEYRAFPKVAATV